MWQGCLLDLRPKSPGEKGTKLRRLVALTAAVTVVALGLLELKNFQKWVISLWLNPNYHRQKHVTQNSAIRPQSPACGTKVACQILISTAALTSGWNTLMPFSPNGSVGPYGQEDLAPSASFPASVVLAPQSRSRTDKSKNIRRIIFLVQGCGKEGYWGCCSTLDLQDSLQNNKCSCNTSPCVWALMVL